MGLLPPAPTRRMFSLPHGSGTRPRMPCASTAARGTSSGCASSTWWPRTTATCRSRPYTAAGATIWAYRSATGSGLGSRCTIGLRHLAMRRCRPRELWRLSASQGGWTAGAWVFGMCMGAWILWGNARQRPSWPRCQRARAPADARFPLDTRLCSAASRLLSSACKFVHKGPVFRAIGDPIGSWCRNRPLEFLPSARPTPRLAPGMARRERNGASRASSSDSSDDSTSSDDDERRPTKRARPRQERDRGRSRERGQRDRREREWDRDRSQRRKASPRRAGSPRRARSPRRSPPRRDSREDRSERERERPERPRGPERHNTERDRDEGGRPPRLAVTSQRPVGSDVRGVGEVVRRDGVVTLAQLNAGISSAPSTHVLLR